MTRIRLLRNLRTLVIGLVVVGIIGGATTLIYLNEIGLTDNLRGKITHALRQRNVHATFGSIRFDVVRGITAKDVIVYKDASHEEEIARFPRVSVEVDKTKALRGIIRLERLSCRDGTAILSIFDETPEETQLTINELETEITFHRSDLVEIQTLTARLERVQVELAGSLIVPPFVDDGSEAVEMPADQRERLAAMIAEVISWRIPPAESFDPRLQIRIDGNTSQPELVRVMFRSQIPQLQRADYVLQNIELNGVYDNHLLTLETLSYADTTGAAEISGLYDIATREGELNITSSIDLQRLAKEALDHTFAADLRIGDGSAVTSHVTWGPSADGQSMSLRATGSLAAQDVTFRSLAFDSFESQFSWRPDALYLRGINARNAEGGLTGRFLKEAQDVRYRLVTSLPISYYRDLFRRESTKELIDKFALNPDGKSIITLAGRGTIGQPEAWTTKGSARVNSLRFNTVPLHQIELDFTFRHMSSVLENIAVEFDYSDSPWRKTYGGPDRAILIAPTVKIDGRERLLHIPSVKGRVWPEHALRMFVPKAQQFTASYKFHSPPEMTGTGTFDLDKSGHRSDFTCVVSSQSQMDWDFLGKPLPLQNAGARLRFRRGMTDVTSLSAGLFSGNIRCNLRVANKPNQPILTAGAIVLQDLSAAEIAALYEIESIDSGELNGATRFTLIGGNPRTLQGQGNLSLTDTRLFSVPVFGPLSPLISGLLSDDRAGYERAKKATVSYVVKDGVAHFDDFVASTRSLRFLGEGAVDFSKGTFGMTLRMNGRGILQLLDLPLKPLMGLFQFTGEGSLSEPKWRNTPFVRPQAAREKFLY